MLRIMNTFNLFNANAIFIRKPDQAANKQANNPNSPTLVDREVSEYNVMKSHNQLRNGSNLIETISYHNVPRLT